MFDRGRSAETARETMTGQEDSEYMQDRRQHVQKTLGMYRTEDSKHVQKRIIEFRRIKTTAGQKTVNMEKV